MRQPLLNALVRRSVKGIVHLARVLDYEAGVHVASGVTLAAVREAGTELDRQLAARKAA